MASSRETAETIATARRFVRAAGRRVGCEGDEPELQRLAELQADVADALATAVAGWLAMGRSFTDVGRALGISRQAALKRWGHLQREA